MIRCLLCLVLIGAAALSLGTPGQAQAAEPQVAHMVFFKLAENNAANQKKLVSACNKYLSDHEGIVYYSAGVRAKELKREVNDLDFDVSLHLVFENAAAQEKYQSHPEHLKFIAESKDLWSGVRVFDSYVMPVKAK
jgi:hypothetical protein